MDYIPLLFGTIEVAVIFLFGCVGEIFYEKSGHLNLGIPGIVCVGGAGGVFGTFLMMNLNPDMPGFVVLLFAMLMSVVFSCALGGIYSFLTITFRCNQNVTGLALSIFGNGFTSFVLNQFILPRENASTLLSIAGQKIFCASLPFAKDLGFFGQVFLNHGFLVYFGLIVAILSSILLFRTKIGLNLRAVGEDPATADAVGIPVIKYKYIFNFLGAAIAGFAGTAYIMNYMNGIIGASVSADLEAFGWLSVALVIFTLWRPHLSILGSLIFGFLYIAPSYASVLFPGVTFTFYGKELLNLIPYVVTIVVLIITSIIGKKNVQAPAALGKPYFREDR